MALFEVCTSAVIDYKRAEELLKRGAEPLGYVEDDEGWPDNLYDMIIWKLYDGQDTKEDYYKLTDRRKSIFSWNQATSINKKAQHREHLDLIGYSMYNLQKE